MRRLLIVCLGITVAGSGAAAQSQQIGLKNLTKVDVEVGVNGELPPLIGEARVRTLTELRLRAAGLKVLTGEESLKDPDPIPTVKVEVTSMKVANEAGGAYFGYAFSTRLRLIEFLLVERHKTVYDVNQWEQAYLGTSGRDSGDKSIETAIGRLLDEFLNAWLKANPRTN